MSRRSICGFTLIEVLVAIALILALVGTMYGFLFDLMSSRRSILEHVRQETACSALLMQLETALGTCIVGDRTAGSGVAGDERSIRVLSRGVAASLAARGVDDPDAFGDLQVSEYRFDPAQHRIEGRRGPIGGIGGGTGNSSGSDFTFTPLEGVVHKVRFRYYDGTQWLSDFDSMAVNRLPMAVEVAVWFSPVSDESESDDVESSGAIDVDATDSESNADDATRVADADESSSSALRSSSSESLPRPDRVRLLLIPDARDQTDAAATESMNSESTGGGSE